MSMTLIFDFDGTLALTLEETAKIFNTLAPEFNLPQITKENVHLFREKSIRELLKLYPLSPLQLLKLTRGIQLKLKTKINQTPLPPGMKPALQSLHRRGFTLGIVTTNSKPNVEAFLAHHQLTEFFKFVYAERHILGKAKALKNCLQKYKLGRTDVWYIGDEVRDVEAARGAGIKIVSVTWGMNSEIRLRKAKPDQVVSQPRELLQLTFISD